MSDFIPNDKVEDALVALITAAVSALDPVPQVLAGKDSEDKELPVIRCVAHGDGEMDPPNSGNFWIQAAIQVRTSGVDADSFDAKAKNQELLAAISGVLNVDNLPALLSAAISDFTTFGVIFGAPDSKEDSSGVWMDEIPMRVYCCGTAIAA